MKAVERVVEHIISHREELSNFGRIAVEVYIAYVLERVIEHMHEAVGSCLGRLMEKVGEYRESVTEDILPGILEKIKKTFAALLPTAKFLWEKASEFFHKLISLFQRA